MNLIDGSGAFHVDRRQFLALAGIGVATVAAGCSSTSSSTATLETPPYPEPDQFVSKDGVLNAAVNVTREPIDIGDQKVLATVYNGKFLGPTLRLRPGERLELAVTNSLPEITNVHFHGMHVSPSGISDNVFLTINPGQTQNYVLDVPKNHPMGTFWYHTHAHPYTEAQVFGGLAALLVIDGLTDLLPPELRGIKEQTVALKDYQAANGEILRTKIDSNAPTTRTVNGTVNPTLQIDAGETQLWRLANLGADIYYELQLDGHQFHVIGVDGNPAWRVEGTDSIVLPPGNRFDVLVQGGIPGTYTLKTLKYDQQGDVYPETALATVNVNESSQTPATLPTGLAGPASLSATKVDKTRTIRFAKDQATGHFLIDGQMYDHNRIDQSVPLGAVEDWTVRNENSQQHPFHIHINDFQVMSINGQPFDAISRQDTVNVPANGEVVVRIPFYDFKGKFVYHCHILNHADMGMMANVEVV
ncbi:MULTISPECIES: multicopper oxidase family protein [unclassified Mycobacterium]|uniref:multicopper oxidase family protein n=1 Tax=unclassified Mycobacterium TaxID=2642494 RepID=UPI0029C67CF5|nr:MULTISPECIES: multicopper oxidase family protein [unclassified Mycobacterium]